jgi:DNA-directed RNA polymerase specialized sigma24 family protein
MTRAPKEETDEMLVLRKSGMTYQQIADRYGLHVSSVKQRLGLKPKCSPYRHPLEPGYRTL